MRGIGRVRASALSARRGANKPFLLRCGIYIEGFPLHSLFFHAFSMGAGRTLRKLVSPLGLMPQG